MPSFHVFDLNTREKGKNCTKHESRDGRTDGWTDTDTFKSTKIMRYVFPRIML